jgi:hypothetical protein
MMMKKIFIAIAMIAMLASCAKETVTPEPPVMPDPLNIQNRTFLVIAGDMLTHGELLLFTDSTMIYDGAVYAFSRALGASIGYLTDFLNCGSFTVSREITGVGATGKVLRLNACDGTTADIIPVP